MKEAIGLIAGDGNLPLLLAAAVRARGHSVVAIGHRGLTRSELEAAVDTLRWVNIGELGGMIEGLKEKGVRGVFGPGTPIEEIASFIRGHVKR